MIDNKKKEEKNVLGANLSIAGTKPLTGYYRDGYCSTGASDTGKHVIAATMTDAFLAFSLTKGNDLASV